MNELVVKIEERNGVNVVSSRVVAEQLGKEHKNVIRDLENILSSSDVSHLIIASTYRAKTGTYKEYLLTKDGFTLYMFNIQGHNDFKLAYINKFNEMENFIRNNVPQITEEQKLVLSIYNGGVEAIESTKRLVELKTKPLENKIIEQQPKVEYHDNVLKSDKLLTTTQIAKDLGISAIKLNAKLKEMGIIYKKSDTWFFYAKYENRIPEYADYVIGDTYQHLKWTEKGRQWIIELLGGNK